MIFPPYSTIFLFFLVSFPCFIFFWKEFIITASPFESNQKTNILLKHELSTFQRLFFISKAFFRQFQLVLDCCISFIEHHMETNQVIYSSDHLVSILWDLNELMHTSLIFSKVTVLRSFGACSQASLSYYWSWSLFQVRNSWYFFLFTLWTFHILLVIICIFIHSWESDQNYVRKRVMAFTNLRCIWRHRH